MKHGLIVPEISSSLIQKNLSIFPLSKAGESWQNKVKKVRAEMAEISCSAMFLSKLDEIAWLFNLRGNDIPYNPVFYSYAIIEPKKETFSYTPVC